MKVRTVRNAADCVQIIDAARLSADAALRMLTGLAGHASQPVDALQALWALKTSKLGFNPLDSDEPLNLIEQLNQSFTYVASARAAQVLLELHSELAPFSLNLGTSPGYDIESDAGGGVRAEVFAAVAPSSNRKLAKDVSRLTGQPFAHKYVFFMCPGIGPGRQSHVAVDDVIVWSLGPPQ
jgi:hypothetical protein